MKEFIDTAATIYLIGCPVLTTIFIMIGWCELTCNEAKGMSKFEIAIEFMIILYFG